MKIPPKYINLPNCTDVSAELAIYPVLTAAALWCGISEDDVNEELNKVTEISTGIFDHPYIRCLKPKCMVLHNAIVDGVLPCSRENGRIVDYKDHVSPNRRHISGKHLREYISQHFPNDKPSFLFDEVERSKHTNLSADDFLTLQAKLDAANARIEKAKEFYLEQEKKIKELESLPNQTYIHKLEQEIISLKKNMETINKLSDFIPEHENDFLFLALELRGEIINGETGKKDWMIEQIQKKSTYLKNNQAKAIAIVDVARCLLDCSKYKYLD